MGEKREHAAEPLEEALRQAGRELRYPATPRLAARARARIEAQRQGRLAPAFGWRAGLAGALAVLLLVWAGTQVYLRQNASAPAERGSAYIANLLGGDISVVNLQSDQLAGSIEVGSNPWGIAVSRNGQHLYVAVDGGVSVIDAARRQRTNFLETNPGYNRAKVAISDDERVLLVAGPTRLMRLIDIPSRGTLNEFSINMVPYDIKLSADGRWAYVLSETDGSVAIVDVRTGQLVDQLTFSGSYRGYFMAQSPDGRELYVLRLAKGELWIIDTVSNRARMVQTELKPYWKPTNGDGSERGVVVSRDGTRLYVATEDDFNGGVSVLDTKTFKEIARANLGSGFFGAALSLDGSQLALTIPENNYLTILDANSLGLITSLEVGKSPFRVVVGK